MVWGGLKGYLTTSKFSGLFDYMAMCILRWTGISVEEIKEAGL